MGGQHRRIPSQNPPEAPEDIQQWAKAVAKAHRRAAEESYTDLVRTMQQLHSEGKSLQDIADALNGMGHTTRRGMPWNRVQVLRVLNWAE